MYTTQIPPFRTTPQFFEGWLNKTLWPPREIKTNGGNYLVYLPVEKKRDDLLMVAAFWLPDNEQPRIEYHRGVGYYKPDIDKDPQEKELIQFDIISLSSERIKVRIKWSDPAIEPYIREICNARFVDWQETDERQAQQNRLPEEAPNEPTGQQKLTTINIKSQLPQRSTDLRRWNQIWNIVRGKIRAYPTINSLTKWFKTRPKMPGDDLKCSYDTMKKIVMAGETGLLDLPKVT